MPLWFLSKPANETVLEERWANLWWRGSTQDTVRGQHIFTHPSFNPTIRAAFTTYDAFPSNQMVDSAELMVQEDLGMRHFFLLPFYASIFNDDPLKDTSEVVSSLFKEQPRWQGSSLWTQTLEIHFAYCPHPCGYEHSSKLLCFITKIEIRHLPSHGAVVREMK